MIQIRDTVDMKLKNCPYSSRKYHIAAKIMVNNGTMREPALKMTTSCDTLAGADVELVLSLTSAWTTVLSVMLYDCSVRSSESTCPLYISLTSLLASSSSLKFDLTTIVDKLSDTPALLAGQSGGDNSNYTQDSTV